MSWLRELFYLKDQVHNLTIALLNCERIIKKFVHKAIDDQKISLLNVNPLYFSDCNFDIGVNNLLFVAML